MLVRDDTLYAAYKAKDARFDGRFFVGIASTGVYCRPVCRAKLAKAENCGFFSTAAEAERAGFRPCLLCRPELAPGLAPGDATGELARRAARLLERECGGGQSVREFARRLGCSDRHLRRAFAEEFAVSPVHYLQTRRLLFAKNLLTDTPLSVLAVAMASGFGSVRRFNDVFKSHYKLSPGALRKRAAGTHGPDGQMTLLLGYRPPYLWEAMLRFLAERAVPGVEFVGGNEYWRTASLSGRQGKCVRGWLRVSHKPDRNALAVTMSESLLPVMPDVLARVRHLFDLYCNPDAVGEGLSRMNGLRPGLYLPGTRVPGCFDPFETAVGAVLSRYMALRRARVLAGRIASVHGDPVTGPVGELSHVFPSPGGMTAREAAGQGLEALGVPSAPGETIVAMARALHVGEIDIDPCKEPEAEMEKLLSIPGMGIGTARYIAMRTMEWPDAFFPEDAEVRKTLHARSAAQSLRIAEAWRPWRSYAMIALWDAVGQGHE